MQISTIKHTNGFSYYTGAHPIIKAHKRSGKRPTDFGDKIWATTFVLINYLDTEPFPLTNLRVLEIGCGQGLLGIYLAKKYNCQVICSDYDQNVLPIVQSHADLNQVSITTTQSSFCDISSTILQNIDLIIGCEICYSEEVALEIVQLQSKAKEAGVKHIIIADPGRPDFQLCVDHSATIGYTSELIELAGSVNGKTTHFFHNQLPD